MAKQPSYVKDLMALDMLRTQLDEIAEAYAEVAESIKARGPNQYVTTHFNVSVYPSHTRYLDPDKVARRLTPRQLENCYSESEEYLVLQLRPRLVK